METLWNAVKSLSLWQALLLLAVMVGTAAGVYGLYARAALPPAAAAELTENEQIVPVGYGDIINQVSTNGNLDFPERETAFFSVKGVLGELLVTEGQAVRPGEALARLDAAAVVALEESVAQARFDLRQAEDALQDLQETPDAAQYALDRAAAVQKVADARFKLHQAREALSDLLNPELPTAEEIKRQEEKIADARLKLQQARESREDLLHPESPTAAEIKQQEEKVADARLKLQQAIDDRDDFISKNRRPDYALKIAELDQGRADAAKELAEIQESLDALSPTEKQLVEARQSVQKAQAALDAAEQALENFKDQHGSTLITRRQEKAELETRLNQAKATLAELQADYDKGVLGLYSNIRRWQRYIEVLEPELEDLRRLGVNPGRQVPIRLSSVADIEVHEGPSEIRRIDQQRAVLISANVSGIDLGTMTAMIQQALETIDVPPDVSMVIGGQNKEMETSLNSLTFALGLAIFLVYIVMASQFESFLHPFVIMFSIPLALIGVIVMLFVIGVPLSVVVFLGIIMLAGIVVNNAIVLVDYINHLRRSGSSKIEAIVQAGEVRLRPILMTTSTTVLGLLPMALGLGDGAEIRTPMAITVVAGLISSTLLTLVIIPTVYSLMDRGE